MKTAITALTFACPLPVASEGVTWDWQLSDPFDLAREVQVMDLDAENHTAGEIAALKARSVTLICYVSVGTAENYRADYGDFPDGVMGKVYGDWPDERFLDIRQMDVLLPIMKARFQRCADMGFDAIEPDNQDVWTNESGFPVTEGDTVAYLKALAKLAHGMGLEIGQKNVPELTEKLVGTLDFVITEDCFAQGWCDQVLAYTKAGKPVYVAEYTDQIVDFPAACAWGAANGASVILKDRELTSFRKSCP
jgi:hypothetical protein